MSNCEMLSGPSFVERNPIPDPLSLLCLSAGGRPQERELEDEPAAPAGAVLCSDRAAVSFDHLASDGQLETRTACGPGPRRVDAMESLEDAANEGGDL